MVDGEWGEGAAYQLIKLIYFYPLLWNYLVDSRVHLKKIGTLKDENSPNDFFSLYSTFKVLFPLLDKVKNFSGAAAHETGDATNGGNILIHHSRDTTEKQWAETKVLTLAGVARVFNTWRHALMPLGKL